MSWNRKIVAGFVWMLFVAAGSTSLSSAHADRVIQSWGHKSGWVTVLQQLSNGNRVCKISRSFSGEHPFEIVVLRIASIYQMQFVELPPSGAKSQLVLSLSDNPVATFTLQKHPVMTSVDGAEAIRLLNSLMEVGSATISLRIENRQYAANPEGLIDAVESSDLCEFQANL